MKKRAHFTLPDNTTTFDFHKRVVASKNYKRSLEPGKVDHKKIVEDMEAQIHSAYQQYDTAFSENSLEQLSPIKKTDDQQESLLSLYQYSSLAFTDLRTQLTTYTSGQKETLCPLCLLDHESSLDHCVPKTEFSEFCDHPYNLIPSCSKCNTKKGKEWRDSGVRTALNFYLDDIPQSQFLFADIDLMQDESGKQIVKYHYKIDNPNGEIQDKALYERIKHHFTDKSKVTNESILDRYNNAIYEVISDLCAQLTGSLFDKVDNRKIAVQLLHQATQMQKRYGYNYWKAILIQAISKRIDVIDILRQSI